MRCHADQRDHHRGELGTAASHTTGINELGGRHCIATVSESARRGPARTHRDGCSVMRQRRAREIIL
jgi:hypothetical protein